MKNQKNCLVLCLSLFMVFCVSYVSSSLASEPYNPSGPSAQYPSIEPIKEMGAINYFLKLTFQVPGDWSGFDTSSPTYGGGGLHAYKYMLSYISYTLALVQYHKTPAYRELYQNALDTLIQKMIRMDVWGSWFETSRGSKALNPDLVEYATPWADPVVNKNIMYSGHIMEMIGLYRMLYGDKKYNAEGSVTYKWQPAIDLLGTYTYNHLSLVLRGYDQILNNPWHSIECEPNAVFTVCNEFPLLALMLYDASNGTNYFPPARDLFWAQFTSRYYDFANHRNDFFYMVEQDKVVPTTSPLPADEGNLGMVMNVYEPEFIQEQYPYWKALQPIQPDGTIIANNLYSRFGSLASEMGDSEIVNGFLNWADKNAHPISENGMYYYPRDDSNKMGPWDNVHLTYQRVNIKDGMRIMHTQPWGDAHFAEPYISNVDYPNVLVTQAIYDSDIKSLMFTLIPMAGGSKYKERGVWKTSLNVNNLDPVQTYSISMNGRVIGHLNNGVVKGPRLAWTNGILTISISPQPLKASASFVVQAK